MDIAMDAGSSSEDGEVARQSRDVVAKGAGRMNRYTIDPPPTANKLFRNRTAKDNAKAPGRIRTAAYKRWHDLAAMQVRLQHKGPPLEGNASVTLSVRRYHPRADIDNRIKPVLDALEAGGALVNDKQVTSVCAAWANHDQCIVTVSPDVGTAA